MNKEDVRKFYEFLNQKETELRAIPEMQRTNDALMCVQESWRETRERVEKIRDKESRKAIIGCVFSELHKLEEGCE